MKKIIPFIVIIAGFGIYMVTKENDSNATKQPSVAISGAVTHENTQNALTPPKNTAQVNTTQPKQLQSPTNLPAQTKDKHTANADAQDEIAAITKLVDETLDDKGVFDMEVLSDTINVDDFTMVLDHLNEDSNETEMAKRYEIESLLTKDDELALYDTGVACGQGMCAVNLAGVPNEQLDKIKQKISKLNLGSTFQKVKATSDYESNIRVITPSKKSEVTTIRTKNLGMGS